MSHGMPDHDSEDLMKVGIFSSASAHTSSSAKEGKMRRADIA